MSGVIHIGPVYEGKHVKITGSAPYGSDTFTVNFTTAHNWDCDRPLHISVRFKITTVVRNVLQDDCWGTEERNGPFPFVMGKTFTMVIVVERPAYKIYINGQHCWDFAHRLSFTRTRSLTGDINIDSVEFINFVPSISYQSPIYDGIHEGKQIKVTGSVPYGSDRFTMDLMTAQDWECDHPLHLSVRFQIKTVVRNIYKNNSWDTEERNGPFPFTMGKTFTMIIAVERSAYKIYVNGQHCWDFVHRLPFSRIRSLSIVGEINIDQIEFGNFEKPPVISIPPTSVCVSGSSNSVPCLFPIHGGIRPGMSIYVTGRPTSNPYNFIFNIQKRSSTHPDIAFRFDVRFYNHSVIRNSRLNDVWYCEESMISHFPFQPGCNFDAVIKVQSDMYVVMINGQHLFSFRHRLNAFPHFNVLSIENDVIITSIRYA